MDIPEKFLNLGKFIDCSLLPLNALNSSDIYINFIIILKLIFPQFKLLQIHFNRKCGVDNVCTSDLQLRAVLPGIL